MADFDDIIYPAAGGMNYDSSVETMPQGDYVYALNIVKVEGGEYGMVTNSKGNEEIAISLPGGINQVIGFCEDKENKSGIFFIWGSDGHHSIIRYFPDQDKIDYLLYDQDVLNFSREKGHEIQANIIGIGKDKVLFWTDNYNPPRKLNIYRARAYTNTSTSTTTTTTTTSP